MLNIPRSAVSCLLAVIIVSSLLMRAGEAKDEKLKPEELVAKHLASIGPVDKLKAIKARSTSGPVQVDLRVGVNGTLAGKGNILSLGNSLRGGFNFGALGYSGEQFAFDGNKVTAAQISPGVYPPLSRFLRENDFLMKEGLLFGSLSTGWAFLDLPAKQAKLDLSGLKKVDGRQLYEVKYLARSYKGNIQTFLYFDPETFRHVRSVFKMEMPAPTGRAITDSANLIHYQVLEQFGEFKEVEGLTLPHSYKIEFTIDAPSGGFLGTWTHAIERIGHNEALDRSLFVLE